MMIIEIYRHHGTWAFTDSSKYLTDEPFVAGISEIIDEFIEKFSEKTCSDFFSERFQIDGWKFFRETMDGRTEIF